MVIFFQNLHECDVRQSGGITPQTAEPHRQNTCEQRECDWNQSIDSLLRIHEHLCVPVQVIYFVITMRKPAVHFMSITIWLSVWVGLMWSDNEEAKEVGDNPDANQNRKQFVTVFGVVWRVLLCICVQRVAALIHAAISTWLLLNFHHTNHLQKMQVRPGL